MVINADIEVVLSAVKSTFPRTQGLFVTESVNRWQARPFLLTTCETVGRLDMTRSGPIQRRTLLCQIILLLRESTLTRMVTNSIYDIGIDNVLDLTRSRNAAGIPIVTYPWTNPVIKTQGWTLQFLGVPGT